MQRSERNNSGAEGVEVSHRDMTTIDFITELFCQVDDRFNEHGYNRKHSQAKLYPSEVVTLALLFALKGVGNRAFYRWLVRDYKPLFPYLPERTRLFRLFNTHQHLTDAFMAEPSLLGVIDTYGIELIHPRREGRSPKQIGRGRFPPSADNTARRKGISNQRWIVGGKLCLLLNHLGLSGRFPAVVRGITPLVVDWDCDTANVYDGSAFQHIVEGVEEQMVVFADEHFRKTDWHPDNLRLCKPGEWNDRMLIETVLSMLTSVAVRFVCEATNAFRLSFQESYAPRMGLLQSTP